MNILLAPDENAQIECGRALAARLFGRAGLVFLSGELGAGKTTLARGVLRGFGHQGPVRSPSYTLIESYTFDHRGAPWPVFHLDLYRLGDAEELEYLGWRELLDDGALLLIEWPERAAGLLPQPQLEIRIDPRGSGRQLRLTPCAAWGEFVAALPAAP